MSSAQQSGRRRTPATTQATKTATLSIVVVSAGPVDARHGAARVLLSSPASSAAQVVMVSRGEPDLELMSLLNPGGAVHVSAPTGCTRAEMCDLGMRYATGSIVAVRDDVDVGDAAWLQAFRSLIPDVATAALAARDRADGGETVMMDTMQPTLGLRDDLATLRQPPADLSRSPVASVEMAAIM